MPAKATPKPYVQVYLLLCGRHYCLARNERQGTISNKNTIEPRGGGLTRGQAFPLMRHYAHVKSVASPVGGAPVEAEAFLLGLHAAGDFPVVGRDHVLVVEHAPHLLAA